MSQNITACYCDKNVVDDISKLDKLKNIAYYFETRGPILIDDKGLRKIFYDNGISLEDNFLNLNSGDIIREINMCLESDAVYVCNPNKTLDNSSMFVLGYLMAMGQEIFFENEVNESEWLLTSILNRNTEFIIPVNNFFDNIPKTVCFTLQLN